MKNYWLFVVLLALVSCNNTGNEVREYINIEGEWQFALDTSRVGIAQKWYMSGLDDSVTLPGTTDTNHKGFLNNDTTTMHLNRVYRYAGQAWYRRMVFVPEGFWDKHIQLFFERAKPSNVWIDSMYVGQSLLLQSPQQFDVTGYLTPGEHFITVMVDNDLSLTPYGNVHIYSDDTQTNWNGILGKMYLEASSKTYIKNLQVYPDIEGKKVAVKIEVESPLSPDSISVELMAVKTINGKTKKLKAVKAEVACHPVIYLEYFIGDDCSLWDEYSQALYTLTAIISNGNVKDVATAPFGMRKFSAVGTQFEINGRTTFLRGKHEAAVFPLTGYPPMDVEGWARVYRIAKTYGINHYRFHSYCPPEAAFTAADQEGIYLQAELPFWGGLESDTVANMLREEGYALLKAYANHPSFVMFSHGNEIWSGHDRVEKNIIALKEYDSRPLYTMGSNNNIGYAPPRPCSDFFVAVRTPYEKDTILTHTRLAHGYCDSWEGGILNTQTPSTDFNFEYAVKNIDIPIVSHEIGQYQIYPDYSEIDKYTGVLRAWNLEVFKNGLQLAGMSDQDIDFHKATGAWSALCYKAEMEAALRTPGLAGFQLLDLQDFPGQGTALVGILDAFMDSKDVVSREDWLSSCNDVVLLLEFPKYCWTNNENFKAKAFVANYSNSDLTSLEWELENGEGEVLATGIFDLSAKFGGITEVGDINVSLAVVNNAEKLTVKLSVPGMDYANKYPVWVYPSTNEEINTGGVFISEKLDENVLDKLFDGGKVLLFPQEADVKENVFAGHFPPEFWNYGMFKTISEMVGKPVSPGTLGLLTNPAHPLFNLFPTDYHTNWQWFSIVKAGNSLILDDTGNDYRPVVQVIDNLERNHKLGLIFEFKVGEGELLVCMSPVNRMADKPEAVQLYRSILNYMQSADFNPKYEIGSDKLKDLFGTKKVEI